MVTTVTCMACLYCPQIPVSAFLNYFSDCTDGLNRSTDGGCVSVIPFWYRADLLPVEIQQRKTADAHVKAALTCLFHFQTVYSTQLECLRRVCRY